jgi:hypothetical protein
VGYGDIPLGQGGTHITVGIYTFLSTILLAFAISNLTDVYQVQLLLYSYLLTYCIYAHRKRGTHL